VTKQKILIGLLGFLFLSAVTQAAAEEFTYRGVKFGMTREEVSKLVPLKKGSDKERATGQTNFEDNTVFFQFDDTGRLYAIEISYFIPDPKHIVLPAMRKALAKKYGVSNPSEKVWDHGDVRISFGEYYISNPAQYLRTTITHKRLYDEYLDRVGTLLGDRLKD